MPKLIHIRTVYGIDLTIDKAALEQATERINDVFRGAAREFVRSAKSRAPYDPDSRHARGLTRFPAVHHRDSIRFGTMVSKKGQPGEINRAVSFGFFGVNGKPLKSAFIKSNSGRGYWLEYGTTGKTKSGEYLVRFDRNARRQSSRLKKSMASGETVREHYATKGKRHFLPAMNAAKRYIKANLKNVA